ncbi:MAG: hypothetical protein Q9188_003439 [Gyalolechia gomerana]
MSSTAVATLVGPPLRSTETTDMPLRLCMSKGDAGPPETRSRRLVYRDSLAKPLEFLTVTNNPEVERKLARNRRTVRSNAIKHAVRARKQVADKCPGLTENPCVAEDSSIPSQREHDALPAGYGNPEAPERCSQEHALRASRRTPPRSLWPTGTVAARTNFAELNLVSTRKQQMPTKASLLITALAKVQSHYSIFSHVLENPDSEKELASVVLQSSVIYHATLYAVTMQQRSCAVLFSSGVRNPLVHEAIVLRSVQDAISKSVLPQDEIIFAISLLGISQLIFERSKSGAIHLDVIYLRFSLMTYSFLLAGMHTLDIADDVEYGHTLPAPSNLRAQLPCHSEDESLRPSEEISFMFLAQRRMIYTEIAQNLQMLATPIKACSVSHSRVHAHAAMLALADWKQNCIQVGYGYKAIPQLDEPARLGGLLYYRLAYEGGSLSTCAAFKALQLQSELVKLRNEQDWSFTSSLGSRKAFGLLPHGCSNRLCLILWILYCGGVFATDELRAWYTKIIRIVSGDTGKDWDRTKEILKYFAWNDDACEGPMRELWRDSLVNDIVAADA